MTIWERTATALATLTGIPAAAAANRSVLGDPLPDVFVVYTLLSAVPQLSADDVETERFYRMQVALFSRSGLNALPDTDTAMAAQGMRFAGEHALEFSQITGHFGLAREYTYLEDI